MPPASNPVVEEISGVIEAANPRGFLLAGRESWLNLSRYADPPPQVPGEGTLVRVGLDKAGFVRTIEVEAEADRSFSSFSEAGAPYAASSGVRDTRIMRQAVLNTATAILSSGGREADAEAVLALAERLESWVTR
ncbi:MAG TPA: hypothetical protein VKV26_11190 [Dehalococcoidia bacterium]|nr:hypothetical protein [Dehalococcoidia bacterium]